MAPGLSKGLRRGSSNISTLISGGTSTDDGVDINPQQSAEVSANSLMGSYYVDLVVTKEPVEGCIAEAAAKLKSVHGEEIPECEITFEWYRNDTKQPFSPSPQYIATAEDIDYPLLVKCCVRDRSTGDLLVESSVTTAPVRQFPTEFPDRAVIFIEPVMSTERPFSILSYNILSRMYTFGKYPSCPDWSLDCWYRRQLVLREIKIRLPDIICLQEVDESCYDFLSAPLDEMHYKIFYKMKDGIREGCLTALRCDTLEYVDLIEHKLPACQGYRTICLHAFRSCFVIP